VRRWQLDKSQGFRSLGFTDGGETLAVQADERTLVRWSRRTGEKQVARLEEPATAKFSPDGSLLVVALPGGPIQLRDARTGKVRGSLRAYNHYVGRMSADGHEGGMMAFTPDGKYLATGGEREVCVWDVAAQKLRARLEGAGRWRHLVISPDGKAVAGYSASSGQQLPELGSGEAPERLLSLRWQSVVTQALQWDVASGKITGSINPGIRGATTHAISPDTRTIVQFLTGTRKDKDLGVLEFRLFATQPAVKQLRLFEEDMKIEEFKLDRSVVTAKEDNGKLRRWDALTGKELTPPQPPPAGWRVVKVSPGGRYTLSMPDGRDTQDDSGDPHLRYKVHDVRTNVDRLNLRGPRSALEDSFDWWIGQAGFSEDDRSLSSVNEDGRVELHDLDTGRLIREFGVQGERMLGTAFAPDGKNLITLGMKPSDLAALADRIRSKKENELAIDVILAIRKFPPVMVRFWDLSNGRQLGQLEVAGLPMARSFSPDGRHFALYSRDGKGASVALLDEKRRRIGASFPVPLDKFRQDGVFPTVGFTQDGKCCYAVLEEIGIFSDSPAGVVFWDVEKQREIAHFKLGTLSCWAVRADGQTFAAGYNDGTLKLWDVRTGQERLSIQAHDKRIVRLNFAADGKTLTSVDRTGLLKVWDGDVGAP
jgi:WD40 repeat protein